MRPFNLHHYAKLQYDHLVYLGFMFDPEFARIYNPVEKKSAIQVDGFMALYKLARQCLHVEGDYWECGVDRGGSARFIAECMEGTDKRLHLFDTFSGMPASDPDIDQHEKGDFPAPPFEETVEFIGHAERVRFHAGLIPDSFGAFQDEKIAFAHIDVDLYAGTKACCEFIYPRMSSRGIMVIDDYNRPTCIGARIAVDEYFADKPEVPLPIILSGQAIVFKL